MTQEEKAAAFDRIMFDAKYHIQWIAENRELRKLGEWFTHACAEVIQKTEALECPCLTCAHVREMDRKRKEASA